MKILENPKLLKLIIDEVHEEGVVGEEDSISILVLKIFLRLVREGKATSSNILVSDATGGGKDHLVKRICKVLLDDELTCFHRTAISPKFLNYWTKYERGQEINFDGKVLYLEDPEDDTIKSQAFKVRASGENKISTLKDQSALTILIQGKPVFIVTSLNASIDIEGVRRWDCIRIDTGEKLTEAVIRYELDKAAGLVKYNPNTELRWALRQLARVKVHVPFAPKLIGQIPYTNIVMRTQIHKLIDYIKASATMHQLQREWEDRIVIANFEDYEFARWVFMALRNAEGEVLNKKEQYFMSYLKLCREPKKVSTIISDTRGVSKEWIYRRLPDWIERELISVEHKYDAGANREIEHLSFTGNIIRNILKPAKILFNANGYLSSGEFYKEVNKDRAKNNLQPIFEGII